MKNRLKKPVKNLFFYCCRYRRRAMPFAFLSLFSLLQFSCDGLAENCLDPTTNCFRGVDSIKLVRSTPDVSAGVDVGFNKITLTFSEELSNISNIEDKDAYSFSGDGAIDFKITKIDKVNDTTVEIQFEGDISEGPIQLDFSKLKDSDGNTLGGTTSISFTNSFKATVALKSMTTTIANGSNITTIDAPVDSTISGGDTIPSFEVGTVTVAAVNNPIKITPPSGVSTTITIDSGASTTTRIRSSTTANVVFPAGTHKYINGSTGTGTGNENVAPPPSLVLSDGRFATPSTGGTITITTTGGTITTTGGTITIGTTGHATSHATFEWSTNLKGASYHMGSGTSGTCPLKSLNQTSATIATDRLEADTRFQEGYPPSTSNNNNNVSSERGSDPKVPTPLDGSEITTTISAKNLVGNSLNNLIICVEQKSGKYISKTFSVYRQGTGA